MRGPERLAGTLDGITTARSTTPASTSNPSALHLRAGRALVTGFVPTIAINARNRGTIDVASASCPLLAVSHAGQYLATGEPREPLEAPGGAPTRSCYI
jgi:hypothetical protein